MTIQMVNRISAFAPSPFNRIQNHMVYDMAKEVEHGINFYSYNQRSITPLIKDGENIAAVFYIRESMDIVDSKTEQLRECETQIREFFSKFPNISSAFFDVERRKFISYEDFGSRTPMYTEWNLFVKSGFTGIVSTGLESVSFVESVMALEFSILSFLAKSQEVPNPSNGRSEFGTAFNVFFYGIDKSTPKTIELTSEQLRESCGKNDVMEILSFKIQRQFRTGEVIERTIDGMPESIIAKSVRKVNFDDPTAKQTVEDDEEFSGSVDLSKIIDHGLKRIITRIKNPSERVEVNIDFPGCNIKWMYIMQGCAFIRPIDTHSSIEEFMELFNSTDVVFLGGI